MTSTAWLRQVVGRRIGRRGDADTDEAVAREAPSAAVAVVTAVAVAASIVVMLVLIRPFTVGPVGFDSAASVLYFDRILSGQKLETFLGATPKPLLTLVYGVLYGLTHDWRFVSWSVIAVQAAAVGAAGLLIGRVAGPSAAAFAAFGLLGLAPLLTDVTLAYATPFALLAVLVAGLAVTRTKPAYLLAGVALLPATLARIEVLALVGVVTVAVVIAYARERSSGAARRRPTYALLLIAFLAVPIMMIHDVLLTGDAFYWLKVSGVYSATYPDTVLSPIELAGFVIRRYLPFAPILVLAVVGVTWAVRRRQWPTVVGFAGVGPGILALLFVLAARGTYTSARYFILIDVALVLAAAIGVGVVVRIVAAALEGRSAAVARIGGVARAIAAVAVGGILAVVLVRPWAPLDTRTRASLTSNVQTFRNSDTAARAIRTDSDGRYARDGGTLIIPPLLQPRLAVQLNLPLTRVVSSAVAASGSLLPAPRPGDYVVHESRLDRPATAYDRYEVAQPLAEGDIVLDPLVSDRRGGVWVYNVRPR